MKPKTLEEWIAFLGGIEIPVLKQTARELAVLHADRESISARDVAKAIAHDPMMTLKLLRFLQKNRHKRQEHEVFEVEHAMLMLGVESFFTKIPPEPLIESVLKDNMAALVRLLHVVHRSHRASSYAFDWAVRLRDLHFEEVRIAALLHDLAEMLMWCFSPNEMLKISAMQQKDKALRSADAQMQVLGFPLEDLQRALAQEWDLPELLLTLMDSECADQPRVKNVVLAVNFARHLTKGGWEDAALPDDFKDIGALLGMEPDDVMVMLGDEAGILCELDKPHL